MNSALCAPLNKSTNSGPHLRKNEVENPLRRRGPVASMRRGLFSLRAWLFDVDFKTIEKITINYQFAAVFAVVFYTNRVVAVPPPLWRSVEPLALRLPAWGWVLLLLIGSSYQLWAKKCENVCQQRNGAILSMTVAGMMLGALFLQASGWACVAASAFWYQVLLAGKLYLKCKADYDDDDF